MAVTDVNAAGARDVADEIDGGGYELDVRSDGSIRAAVEAAERDLGPLFRARVDRCPLPPHAVAGLVPDDLLPAVPEPDRPPQGTMSPSSGGKSWGRKRHWQPVRKT